jgi:hypothetical protein
MDGKRQEYVYMYKCRLCGELYRGMHFTSDRVDAIMRICTIIRDGSYTFGMTVTQTDMHRCNDGNLGIADLQGVRVINP